jgi:SpoVK/Ycf46/Vps4 family AAA+-type ATPase
MNPLVSFLTGRGYRRIVDTINPARTFSDVVLPPGTRRMLDQALAEVRNHELIFRHWGLGERHSLGRGLTFNFAGPPGTGKTICAEAVAHALGMKLLVVNYAEAESMWAGETPKNIAAIFRGAADEGAVLFFDEADAISARRSTGSGLPYEREMNITVNVLLRELEAFNGVAIFATNVAASFDPAFERRIRTHVLFEMPGAEQRERIWRLQVHPTKTPLASDVDFHALAIRYDASGGDIKNAVIKAAASAATEPGPDVAKKIEQRHFQAAIEDVLAARSVMRQSILSEEPAAPLPVELAPQPSSHLWNAAIAMSALSVIALVVSIIAIWIALKR